MSGLPQSIQSGGVAMSTRIIDGTQHIWSGGRAVSTTLSGSIQEIDFGGTATGTILREAATEYVDSRGRALNTTVSAGGFEILSSGSVANGTSVQSGGTAQVELGATLSGVQLSSGGTLVLDGGKVADLAVKTGGVLDFAALTAAKPETLSFTENAAKTQGVLTVTDGTLHASVALFGNYVAAGFHLAFERSVGTAVTYQTTSSAHLDFGAGHR